MLYPRRFSALGLLLSIASIVVSSTAQAGPNDPKLRYQRDVQGDIAVFGSTLAHDCGTKATLPSGVTVSCTGQNNIADTAPDIYWRDDVANASITPLQARTSATLVMPANAKVVYARLYWAAIKKGKDADKTATLDWLGGPSVTVNADTTWTLPTNLIALPDTHYYQASGDVTSFISQWGAGDFRVTDVDGLPLAGLDLDRAFTGWTIVVFYENPGDDPRNLALFDGFSYIAPKEGTPKAEVTLSGFLVPPGFDAKMAALAYEGDFDYDGDSFSINGNKVSNALNPVSNFFNSSRSFLGNPVSGEYDSPKLSGQPGIMSGYDLDTVDISTFVKPGDTSAKISAESSLDIFILGAFATSITNKTPNFTVTKTALDLNGEALLPGDEIEYTITLKNTGNDTSIETVLTDTLDPNLDFVAGSLTINGAPKTDASGDDEAKFDSGTKTITWYLGSSASSGKGGQIEAKKSVTVSFRAKVSPELEEGGSIANQALLSGVGQAIRDKNPNAPKSEWLSDGDPDQVGPQKTIVTVMECQTDKDCNEPTKPHCDVKSFSCQPCQADKDCSNPLFPACQSDGSCNECSKSNQNNCKDDEPVCNVSSGTCTVCIPDPNGDSSKCKGNPKGEICVIGSNNTYLCGCTKDSDCGTEFSGKVCNTITLECQDGCRGEGGNKCPTGIGLSCTSQDSSIGNCVSNPENTDDKCSDGKDNDGDGKVDCDDPDCKNNSAVTACLENTDKKCSDSQDNDGDGQVDCDDSDCKNNPKVTVCTIKEDTNEKCSDGKDNDGNGLIDCKDPSCHAESISVCLENTNEKCSDSKDNDADGQVDCADSDCKDNPNVTVCGSKEDTPEACKDGVDNDGNGKIDCNDESCKNLPASFCGDENTNEKCSDGIDNDGNGKVDCADPSCSENSSVTVCGENTDAKCKDGIDNDGDGKKDCEDPNCLAAGLTACADLSDGKGKSENTDEKCSDGIDNDGNGKVDCADPDCHSTGVTVCQSAVSGDDPDVAQDGGCGCAVPGREAPANTSALLLGLAGLGLVAARRRRDR